jgi:hypothetical protein
VEIPLQHKYNCTSAGETLSMVSSISRHLGLAAVPPRLAGCDLSQESDRQTAAECLAKNHWKNLHQQG